MREKNKKENRIKENEILNTKDRKDKNDLKGINKDIQEEKIKEIKRDNKEEINKDIQEEKIKKIKRDNKEEINKDIQEEKIKEIKRDNKEEINKNNPIKFKLDKKNMMRKNKTNSLQINNKNEFLNSFNLPKDKITSTNIEIDIININENNIVRYNKKSIKKYLNNKTQSNSEAELIRDTNNKNSKNALINTCTSKSLKKEKVNKNNNDKKLDNNNNNDTNNNNGNEMKIINVKEMKENYHKLLRGNKFTHGFYYLNIF